MDIVSLPIDIDKSVIDSRFRLVIVAAQRARQIMEGEKLLIEESNFKNTTNATMEILSGKLEILYGDEAVSAQRKERRQREEIKRRAILAEREEALSSTVESKKNLNILLGIPDTPPPSTEAKK